MVDRPLFHVHIPKTGGTTLFEALADAFGWEHVWQITTEQVSAELIAARAANLRLLGGHLTWTAVRVLPVPPRVITVIRDPIDRALSVIGYFRENADRGIFDSHTTALARETKSRTLDELIFDRGSALRPIIGPIQVGFLSTDTQRLRYDTSLLGPDGEPDSPRMDAALQSALRNLDACWWVGTTGTLQRDMASLWRRLGWPPPEHVMRKNTTADRPDRPALSGPALAELERLVAADLALFERARQLADAAAS